MAPSALAGPPLVSAGRARRLLRKLRRALRRDGMIGTVRLALFRVRQRVWISETHVWYQLGRASAPAADLPPDSELVRFAGDQTDGLTGLGLIGADLDIAAQRLRDGAELWVVVRADDALFECFTYRQQAPIAGAPGGAIEVPDGMAIIEDVITAVPHRGRGIAPAALGSVATRLAEAGADTVLAKVERDNRASRRAFRKAGFRTLARMRRRTRGPVTAVALDGPPNDRAVVVLRERITGHAGASPSKTP